MAALNSAGNSPFRARARTAAKIGAVFVVLLAVSACSCGARSFVALGLAPDGSIVEGDVVRGVRSRLVEPVKSAEQTSDGDYLAWVPDEDLYEIDLSRSVTEACTDDGVCVEIRGLTIVEVSPAGDETLIFDVGDRSYAINGEGDGCAADLRSELFDVVSNGETVVVAMGPLGAMVRTPDGEWLPTGRNNQFPSIAKTAGDPRSFTIIAYVMPLLGALLGVAFGLRFPLSSSNRKTLVGLAVLAALASPLVIYFGPLALGGGSVGQLVFSIFVGLGILAACVGIALISRQKPVPAAPTAQHSVY